MNATFTVAGRSRPAQRTGYHGKLPGSIQDLPGDGRQVQNLAFIVPGVSAGWNLSAAANRYGKARENTEGAFNANGARSRSHDFLFDGMPMNLRQYRVINFEPSNEAVQEFKVLSSVPEAEYGRTMGGQVSIVTCSQVPLGGVFAYKSRTWIGHKARWAETPLQI